MPSFRFAAPLAVALTLLAAAPQYSQPGLAQPEQADAVKEAGPALRLKPGSDLQQGQQVRIELDPAGAQGPFKAQLGGKTVELYEQGDKAVCFWGLAADQKPGGYTLRVLDAQGAAVATQKIEVRAVGRGSQNIRYYTPNLTPEQQKRLDAEEAVVQSAIHARSTAPAWQGAFNLPAPHRVSAVYGIRRYLNGKYNGYHGGVDFLTPMGYPLKAPAAGKVTVARYFAPYNSNGNLVYIDHGLGVGTVYLHLSKILVKEGQLIKKGEAFALVGSTGRSTGPHLHWGVYLNGQNTDGLGWVKFTQGL